MMTSASASTGLPIFLPARVDTSPWCRRPESLPSLEPDTALLPGRHLPHVLFEVLEGGDPALEDLLSGTEKLDPASTADLALHDAGSGDDAKARNLDRGDDLDSTLPDLTIRRLAQAL